ncbi:MAG: hypothetical protein ACRD88_05880, partial [Terriglobia bacterium]
YELQTKESEERPVPFLLKLAGQNHPVPYDCPFNTVAIHDLALAILKKELSTPEQVVGWLDRRDESGEGASAGGCGTIRKEE